MGCLLVIEEGWWSCTSSSRRQISPSSVSAMIRVALRCERWRIIARISIGGSRRPSSCFLVCWALPRQRFVTSDTNLLFFVYYLVPCLFLVSQIALKLLPLPIILFFKKIECNTIDSSYWWWWWWWWWWWRWSWWSWWQRWWNYLSHIMAFYFVQGLDISQAAAESLIESSRGDMRHVLNCLQMWRRNSKHIEAGSMKKRIGDSQKVIFSISLLLPSWYQCNRIV